MTKEVKKQPELRFPEFTDDWEQRKLGDVAKYRNGKAHENDISEQGKFIVVNSKFVSTNGELRKFSNKQIEPLFKNEIAFVLSDVPNGRAIARTFLVDKNDKYTLNQRIAGITPIEGTCPYFLHILMNRNKYFLQFDDGAKQTNLSVNDVIEFVEYYPSSEEQQQIGVFFQQLDHLITLHQHELDELKELKQGMLQRMFPKKGETVPEIQFPEFTGDWRQSKLGDVGNTYTGLSGKTADDFGHGEANFITYMNVYSNNIADPTMVSPIEIDEKQHEVEVGDVFFTTSSETPDEVGMSCVLKEKQGIVYLNSFCFGFRPTKSFDLNFLAYMLRSNYVRNQIKILAQGVSRYNISKTKMMDVSIIFPDYEEQKKIGEYFSNLDNLITLHQRELDGYKELKKGLLQQMFC